MYDDMCDLSRGHCKLSGTYYFWETWAFEYFPCTRPELIQAYLGLGLVPLAWRWYRTNLQTVRRRKLLRDLQTFFDTCTVDQEFCAIIGCDPNAPLVKHEVKVGYVRSFESLFQFSRPQARAMIVGDQKAILLPLIDEFSEVHSDDPDRMRLRMRALVFCLLAGFLFNKDPGFGDLRLCPMVQQMEDMGCIGGIVLAETIRSLDRVALGFDEWTVSPIILQDPLFRFG
ncbi:hypothetical protein JCGZ_03211 [Jatropha curcas]|uniref:Aminotransferase-like plant mobile domain-containing protein n=1 Tax=Jatropha curcas TaxID=180498 RepID=A0A067JQF1_JATCU|nr:hypothetical protein JCGZ_03211 [Jatropha curcas]